MALQSFGLLAGGLRGFAGQVTVSVAATVCATAIYGHIVSERVALQAQPEPAASGSPARVSGGVIGVQTLAYYPEHLAALDSLARFHPVSATRTAELATELRSTRIAALSDAAKPRHVAAAEVLPPARPTTLAQVDVLPPRRPATPAPASAIVPANPAPPASHGAKIWGLELPHFVPTGAAVINKLASMKDRIGGLIHVSSR
jgi:hypothetical protein